MAEVLAILSGGAGLVSMAIQLSESVTRLKTFYRAFKHAPETLIQLAFEIETFSLLLQEVGSQWPSNSTLSSQATERCIYTCMKQVQTIAATVEKLQTFLHRSSILGKLRSALDSKELDHLCDGLERAKSSLAIALQLLTMMQLRHRGEGTKKRQSLAMEQVVASSNGNQMLRHVRHEESEAKMHSTSPQDMVAELANDHAVSVSKQRSAASKVIRYRLKPWFVSRLWDLSLCKSYAGWNIQLQTINVIPADAEIFLRYRQGDTARIQELFSRGLASPYDRPGAMTESVLLQCMRSMNEQFVLSMVKLFGLQTFERTELSHFLGTLASEHDSLGYSSNFSIDMYRLVIDHMDVGPKGLAYAQWWISCPNLECLQLVENAMPLAYMDLPWDIRFPHALALSRKLHTVDERMFLQPLGGDFQDPRLLASKTSDGCTILFAIAYMTAHGSIEHTEDSVWVQLACRAVNTAGMLHAKSDSGQTVLAFILESWIEFYNVTSALQRWASLLQRAGVDLLAYGQKERAIWSPISNDWCFVSDWCYGSEVEDWIVWMRETICVPIYEQNDLTKMPGAWTATDHTEPLTVPWIPTAEDDLFSTSIWRHRSYLRIISQQWPVLSDEGDDERRDEFCLLLSTTQDDNSEVAELIRRSARPISRPRSSSQPPLLDKRWASIEADCDYRRAWLPCYHICPCDSRRRFVKTGEGSATLRRCMRGVHPEVDFQESIDFSIREFRIQCARQKGQRLPSAFYESARLAKANT